MGELGACLGFYFFGNPRYHAIKQVDVLVGIVVSAGEKKVGTRRRISACLSADPDAKVPSISAIIDRSSSTALNVPVLRKSSYL